MRKSILAASVAFALGASVSGLSAQQVRTTPGTREAPRFGLQASYGNDSEFGIGARVRYGLQGLFPRAPLSAIGSVDVFFPGGGLTWFDFNYNIVYNFQPAGAPKLTPYVGGGLNFAYVTGNGGHASELGLNLTGGTEFRSNSRVTPYLDLRFVLGDADQMVLTGGIKF